MSKVLVSYFKDVSSPAAIQSVQDAAVSTQSVQDAAVSTQSVQDAAVSTQSVQDAAVSTQSVQDAAVSTQSVQDAAVSTRTKPEDMGILQDTVCYVLYRYGFDEVWKNQGVGDEKNVFERI